MMSSPPAILLEDLCFCYRKDHILHRIHLRVEEGEFLGIIGPNGGGKTTLLKLLLGLLKPSHGSIQIWGQSPKKARHKMAYVPQRTQFDRLFPLTVEQLVLMGCLSKESLWGGFRKEALHSAHESLERLGLEDKKRDPLSSLSGGQLQRALIARALVSQPKLLLLDEPTANIDPKTQEELLSLLRSLLPEVTILMVTHDLNLVIHSIHRVLCVQHQCTSYLPEEICEHFAMGLYHFPLKESPCQHPLQEKKDV